MRRHLLAHLAAHRGTSDALRHALVDAARVGPLAAPDRDDLTGALLSNDLVDLDDRVRLFRGATSAVRLEAIRNAPGGAAGTLAYAAGATSVKHLVAACSRDDGSGALIRYAYEQRPDSATLAGAILANAAAPDDVRMACARTLAAKWRCPPSDRTRIANYVRVHLVTDYERGLQVADELLGVAGSSEVRDEIATQVRYGRGGPRPDSWEWFEDPTLTVAQVSDWAHRDGSAGAYLRAVRDFTDSSGRLAAEAMSAHPRSRWINERVVRTAGLPTAVRERAARALHDAGQREWARMSGTSELLASASVEFVTWFLDCGYAGHATHELVRRHDITAEDILRVPQLLAPSRATASRPLWLATHPSAAGADRATAARTAGASDDVPLGLAAAICEHWARDGATPPAQVVARVPLWWFDDEAGRWSAPGVRLCVAAALDVLAEHVRTAPQAEALVAIGTGGPAGSVAELVDLVHALTR